MSSRKFAYIHNPKTGTTSVRRTLRKFGLETPKRRHIHLPIQHRLVRRLIDPDTFVFMTVRHPLERAVSAFYFWAGSRNRSLPEFWVLQSLASGMGINEFYRALDLRIVTKVVPHFRTQFSFIESDPHRVNKIIKLEEMETEWPKLINELGIDNVELMHEFKTRHSKWEKELAPDNVKKLTDFYAIDFEKFDYPLP